MSSACDLMSPDEAELLQALATYIEERTDVAKANVVSLLSQQLTIAYVLGGEKAGKILEVTSPVALDGLEPVLDRLGPSLDETFGGLSKELTAVIRGGIADRSTYADVQKRLAEKLRSGWGDTVTFNRVGRTRKYVHVNPDGTLRWAEKTISRPITLSTGTYADNLARTNMKAAYAHGQIERYRESGKKGWRYTSAADERTRPRHLALHGRVFLFGTEEEQQALEVMKEPFCRCQPSVFFDDPELDTDPAIYEEQRREWSQKTYDEWKIDKNIAQVCEANPQSPEDLRELVPHLEKRMKNDDYQILGHNLGMTPRQMAKDTVKSLEENFFYAEKSRKEFTFRHVYRDHHLKDRSRKTGKSPFTLSEVITARNEGEIYKQANSITSIWEAPDGRIINVVLREDDHKIVTAYRIGQNKRDQIQKECEKIAR